MNQEQAIQILNQALDQGFKAGAYSLQDAAFLVQALAVLFPPQSQDVVELTKED
jgi:hypothetical protein